MEDRWKERRRLSATLADIQARAAETLKVITPMGFVLDTSDWLTIARYAKKYGLTTQLVNKWIEREVIPADCVETLAELNSIRLVKDQTYCQPLGPPLFCYCGAIPHGCQNSSDAQNESVADVISRRFHFGTGGYVYVIDAPDYILPNANRG